MHNNDMIDLSAEYPEHLELPDIEQTEVEFS